MLSFPREEQIKVYTLVIHIYEQNPITYLITIVPGNEIVINT